ncbi:MAG TPA: radical SAM protein [Bryobacteraceae bacterium]|jgi:radical SAM superfamily enzyme YgiQ (UPF0313 family)|nr:radical SAM protein [Bryobacteraceae bacterium]
MVLLLRVPSTGDRVGAIDPPISQGLVAASLRTRGFAAEVLDLTWTGDSGLETLATALRDNSLSIVGMSAYQTNMERCLRIAAFIRRMRPDVRILLGGPQATHMPIAGLAAMADVAGLCRGPAEIALPAYIQALARGESSYEGFLHRFEAGIVDGGRPPMPSPAEIRSPVVDGLWPPDRYSFAVSFSSRGCPYGCSFCYTPASSGRRMLYSPLELVLREVALLASAGVPHLFFADPIFIVDQARTLELLEGLRLLHTGLSFSCELRFEHVTEEILAAMARAGFVKVAYGLETANERVLAGIRKSTDLQRFRETVRRTLAHGIAVEAFYMFGLPGETFDDVLRTFDFVASLHEVTDQISEPQQVQLYFGTNLLDRHQAYGIELLHEGPAYLSPAKNFRTQTLGPDDFSALEEEWKRRRGDRPQPQNSGPAIACPVP